MVAAVVVAEVHRVDGDDHIVRAIFKVERVDVADDERQAVGLGGGARLRVADRRGDVVQPGDVRAGAVGDVFGDHAVAAAEIQGGLAGAEARRLDQRVELRHVRKAVLAEVPAEDPLAESRMGAAVGHGVVVSLVEITHRASPRTLKEIRRIDRIERICSR